MSDINSSFASQVLTNVIIVLERVFKFLNARQLNTCARVCSSWRDQAKQEKYSRNQMKWTYFTPEPKDFDSCWNSVQSYISRSWFEPSLVLVFCTSTLWSLTVENESRPRKKRKRTSKLSSSDILNPCLPSKCGYQIIITAGIIGTKENMDTQEFDLDTEALSILMLGHFPGVEFHHFSTTHAECTELAQLWCDQRDNKPNWMKPLHSVNVKMMNLYCPLSGINQEVSYSLFKMFDWPMISGGFVNEKYVRDPNGRFHSSEESCIISGFAICGEEVRVASVLIKSEVESEKEIEKIIKQLKDFEIPLNKAFGLMYACLGRGYHFYHKENVESKIFRKYFPETPLLGFFGNGEIGCVYPPSEFCFNKKENGSSRIGIGTVSSALSTNNSVSEAAANSSDQEEKLSKAQRKRLENEQKNKELMHKIKHPPKLQHAYSTVMCLISLP